MFGEEMTKARAELVTSLESIQENKLRLNFKNSKRLKHKSNNKWKVERNQLNRMRPK